MEVNLCKIGHEKAQLLGAVLAVPASLWAVYDINLN